MLSLKVALIFCSSLFIEALKLNFRIIKLSICVDDFLEVCK